LTSTIRSARLLAGEFERIAGDPPPDPHREESVHFPGCSGGDDRFDQQRSIAASSPVGSEPNAVRLILRSTW
jgi:hypothetical protein